MTSLWYLVRGWFSIDATARSNVYSRCQPSPPQPEAATTTTTTTSDKLLLVLLLNCCCCCCWWCLTRGCLLWRSLVPATCYLVCGQIRTYLCFYQHDPWYLVSRPFNMTKLRDLGTALDTSRGGWRCYLGAFKDAVNFEIDVDFVAHGDRRRRAYVI